MVVTRAATLDNNEIKDNLFSRSIEKNHPFENLIYRAGFDQVNFSTLSSNLGPLDRVEEHKHVFKKKPVFINEIILPLEEDLSAEIPTDMNDLSLDRESTISSNMSLLFPRQRINPRPGGSQE